MELSSISMPPSTNLPASVLGEDTPSGPTPRGVISQSATGVDLPAVGQVRLLGAESSREKVRVDFLLSKILPVIKFDDGLSLAVKTSDTVIGSLKRMSMPVRRFNSLHHEGILVAPQGQRILFYDNRPIVFAKINDTLIPFYRSSEGTAGKNIGSWYPFFGFGNAGWLIKGSLDNMEQNYGNPVIGGIRRILNVALDYDHCYDTDLSVFQNHPLKPSLTDIDSLNRILFENDPKSLSAIASVSKRNGAGEFITNQLKQYIPAQEIMKSLMELRQICDAHAEIKSYVLDRWSRYPSDS